MSDIKYGSVCSGVEAATMAWEGLGWQAQWFSEIEKFPSAVLAHRYPQVPNLGDMTLISKNPIFNERPIDLLVGGTPCQSFSVAGLRLGLDDSRGNLALEYVRLLIAKQPKWFVWENVPGVLSSSKGADFASILSAFTGRTILPQKFAKAGVIQGDPTSVDGAGYSIAYRILDSQHFGVPQRRRRVFVVGHLGDDWRPPVAVLFERESLRRDFTPSREPRKETAGYTPSSFGAYSAGVGTLKKSGGDLGGGSETLITNFTENETVGTLCAKDGEKWGCNQWVGEGKMIGVKVFDETQITSPVNQSNPKEDLSHTLSKGGRPPTLYTEAPFAFKVRGGCEGGGKGFLGSEELTFTLSTSQDQNISYGIPGNWIGRKPENGGNATEPMNNLSPYLTGADRHAAAYSLQGSMIGRNDEAGPQGGGVNKEVSFTLNTTDRHAAAYVNKLYGFDSLNSNSMKSKNPHSGVHEDEIVKTLDTTHNCPSKNQGGNAVLAIATKQQSQNLGDNIANPLCATDHKEPQVVSYGPNNVAPTLTASNNPSRSPQSTEVTNQVAAVYEAASIVRRLTPLECERLQGFPDNFTLIPKAADGNRYKAMGNSMTVQVMKWIGERINIVHELDFLY